VYNAKQSSSIKRPEFKRQKEYNLFSPSYTIHYSAQFVYNVILLAIYVVQVFIEHNPCLTKFDHNITDIFNLAFALGFLILLGDFTNSAFLSIYFRYMIQKEVRTNGKCDASSYRKAQITFYIELAFRSITVLISLF